MTKADVAQLEGQIYEVLREDNPQSVRHVFYRMTDPRLPVAIPKTEAGYVQVQNRMVKMRRAGTLPYGWVTDATRRGYFVNTYHNQADFLRSVAGFYRRDVWAEHDTHVEVWCESRSIAGVIQETCEKYAVSLYPAGGFSSLSLAHQSASYIQGSIDYGDKSKALILYVSYDPAGVLIDRSIESELAGHLEGVPLEFKRIAINENQIAYYDLPTKPRKPGDRRAQHVIATVEAEAMPAHILRGLLEAELDALIPYHYLRSLQAAEESERQAINLLASTI
ncbi:MAG: hypothetical protein NXI15_05520 [Gammaproteobacteria bacterium]|nr:hypothetical protein [Gammaproteobacteria bacterium]